MTAHAWLWPGFLTFVGALLFIDLFVLHRKARVISTREAFLTVSAYVSLAIGFAVLLLILPEPGAHRSLRPVICSNRLCRSTTFSS